MKTLLLLPAILAICGHSESLSEWKQTAAIPIHATLHHVQGIDIEGSTMWVSSVDRKARKGYLSKVEWKTGKLVQQVEIQEGERIHAGGLTLDGRSVWIPVAEYDRDGPTSIQRRNKKTLALEKVFEVKDHIGCIAAGKDGLVGGNWDSRILYNWTRDGRETASRANPRATAYQDIKLTGNVLVGSGVVSRTAGAVEWIDMTGLSVLRRLETGATDRGVPYSNEGMTIRGNRLFLLPEDDPSRLFVFEMRSAPKP